MCGGDFEQAKMFISNKEVIEKLGGGNTDFFSVKNMKSQLEINKRLLGGILLKVALSDNPMKIINAMLNGGCIIGLW